ncbi:hypothetical protein PoB_005968600 [Plakobranchus ocellatus]|uniref:Uncharacterized protein n=1 Tax=Plakobranchus ocellatus TaxID=259542 RepID=A0AAV4CMN8_9GAST|nr:hypothetical protein PoB_005968600 [Plakobranchus ocellatus]
MNLHHNHGLNIVEAQTQYIVSIFYRFSCSIVYTYFCILCFSVPCDSQDDSTGFQICIGLGPEHKVQPSEGGFESPDG